MPKLNDNLRKKKISEKEVNEVLAWYDHAVENATDVTKEELDRFRGVFKNMLEMVPCAYYEMLDKGLVNNRDPDQIKASSFLDEMTKDLDPCLKRLVEHDSSKPTQQLLDGIRDLFTYISYARVGVKGIDQAMEYYYDSIGTLEAEQEKFQYRYETIKENASLTWKDNFYAWYESRVAQGPSTKRLSMQVESRMKKLPDEFCYFVETALMQADPDKEVSLDAYFDIRFNKDTMENKLTDFIRTGSADAMNRAMFFFEQGFAKPKDPEAARAYFEKREAPRLEALAAIEKERDLRDVVLLSELETEQSGRDAYLREQTESRTLLNDHISELRKTDPQKADLWKKESVHWGEENQKWHEKDAEFQEKKRSLLEKKQDILNAAATKRRSLSNSENRAIAKIEKDAAKIEKEKAKALEKMLKDHERRVEKENLPAEIADFRRAQILSGQPQRISAEMRAELMGDRAPQAAPEARTESRKLLDISDHVGSVTRAKEAPLPTKQTEKKLDEPHLELGGK